MPGQRSLATRRAHLLVEADAIVLVLDATRPVPESLRSALFERHAWPDLWDAC